MTLLAEFFTQSYKPAGYTLACSINWVGLFVVGMLFPLLVVGLVPPPCRNIPTQASAPYGSNVGGFLQLILA